ncbi:MAG: ribosome silencing factor [Actinomycetota bacterium]|nr:ribosome silencing factor [Actinomycetota bacterium]
MDWRLLDDDPAAGEGWPTNPLPRARRGSGLHRNERDVPLTLTPEDIARAIASYAEDRKALEIVELDLREVIGYTDYFVICSGRTDRQVKAIHDAIHAGMKNDHGMLPRRVEGLPEARWVLMDYLDVLVHVFTPDTREYYRLEQLWGEAPARTLGTPATATP